MKPGTRPKPTHLKLIEGNRGRRPLNRREARTIPALPSPPQHLSADALEEWSRVAVRLYRLGLLSEVDRAALAAYAQAYGRWVQAERAIVKMAERDHLTCGLMIKTTNGNAIQNPLVGTANKAAADMMRYAAGRLQTPAPEGSLLNAVCQPWKGLAICLSARAITPSCSRFSAAVDRTPHGGGGCELRACGFSAAS